MCDVRGPFSCGDPTGDELGLLAWDGLRCRADALKNSEGNPRLTVSTHPLIIRQSPLYDYSHRLSFNFRTDTPNLSSLANLPVPDDTICEAVHVDNTMTRTKRAKFNSFALRPSRRACIA